MITVNDKRTIAGNDEHFFAYAPGSTEMYLIPHYLKNEFLLWCKCEFFDDRWQLWANFFKYNEIVFKNR